MGHFAAGRRHRRRRSDSRNQVRSDSRNEVQGRQKRAPIESSNSALARHERNPRPGGELEAEGPRASRYGEPWDSRLTARSSWRIPFRLCGPRPKRAVRAWRIPHCRALAAKSQSIGRDSSGAGGCHRSVMRLYPPLARKRDRSRWAGAAKLLHSSAGFGSFRAPIDSIMDPGGQPRRPTDPFLSLLCGFGPLKGCKTRRLTLG